MKRTFAVVVLLAALGALIKLGLKNGEPNLGGASSSASAPGRPPADPEAELRARFASPDERALVDRTLDRYRQTAVAVARTDGIRGLKLLERLDIEAVYLYEKHPNDFRRLRDTLTDEAAAEILLHWREFFGLKRADDVDRGLLIAEVSRLTASQRRIAARYPSALPILLADPATVSEMIERWADDPRDLNDLLVVLSFISLERGAADLRLALRTVDDRGTLALHAFRLQGLEGFALVSLYGPVLDALGSALPLEQALILLRVNTEYVDELLRTHSPETIAGHLGHVGSSGLVELVGGSTNALRLAVEHGERGERALRQAGPDAADVVYGDFAEPTLRNQAVEALADHGPMALAVLEKYAADPDFRDILRTHGSGVIPPVARTDASPETLAILRSKPSWTFSEALAAGILSASGENGQATIRTIKQDGLTRVEALDDTTVRAYQFLPLYDVLHLGNVLRQGYAPTTGEMGWTVLDGCFVLLDALSLAAVQPEGVVAAEAARAEVKAVTRESAKAIGQEAVEAGTEAVARVSAHQATGAATERLSRWWAVRAAGGTYRVLDRASQALPRLGIAQLSDLGRPLCQKAGLRLSTWAPVRLLKNGEEFLLRIPPERGLKYLGAQIAQAGVGVAGFRKMEEHLASRRPQNRID
jgi:hypothetical protein